MPPESTHAADDAAPGVTVTLAAIYDTVLAIDKKVDPIPAAVADHETRIRVIEQRMWRWLGAASVAASAATVLISRAVGG